MGINKTKVVRPYTALNVESSRQPYKKDLVNLFFALEKKLGRQPTITEWDESKITPSKYVVHKYYGTWGKFLKTLKRQKIRWIPSQHGITRKGKRNKILPSPRIDCYGTVVIRDPSHPIADNQGYVKQHRMIAYDAGLIKDKHACVYHINGNKQDNRLSNLTTNPQERRKN